MYSTGDELDGHVSATHGNGRVVCDGCGETVESMNSLHQQESQHRTVHLGACSTQGVPSQRQYRMTRNILTHDYRPRHDDVRHVITYGAGAYLDRIEAQIREMPGPQTRSCARQQAEEELLEDIIDRLHQTYMSNLHHFGNH